MRNPPTPITKIDLEEKFPHLARAPIVESVIDFRARAESAWDEPEITPKLKAALLDYPKSGTLHEFVVSMPIQFPVGPGGDATANPSPAPAKPQDRGWVGLRFESADGLNIATFSRDGFSLSRLRPYQNWEQFSAEAMRLWLVHVAIAVPAEIQRIGVRSINRLDVPIEGLVIGDYLKAMAGSPANLETSVFIYNDVLSVPGYPYAINLIRALQPSDSNSATTVGLLLDIDVSCPGPMVPEAGILKKHLVEMRWLKNRVFFGSVTDRAIGLCR